MARPVLRAGADYGPQVPTLLARFWLFIWRWKVVPPQEPVPKKCVMIASPHTSNWDFPITLAIARLSGVKIQWLGKEQLFKGPMGPIMRWLGGVSIDRSAATGMVSSLAAEFGRRDALVLVVPAEGTRSKTEYWKSGFYRIAQEAEVPIVCAFVDSVTRTGGYGPVITPSGDITADMDMVRAFYAGKVGLSKGKSGVPRLKEEDVDRSGPTGPDAG